VKVFLGKDPHTGKDRQKWIGGFRSVKEARDHLLAVAAAPAFGSGVGPFGSMRVRLGDYLHEWLQSVRQSICEREYRSRLSRLSQHIVPHLGHVPLARLAPVTLQRFFSIDLAAMHPTTAHKVFKDLRQALDHAVRLGLVTNNPARMIEAPRPQPYRPTLFTPDELARFIAACAGSGSKRPAVCDGVCQRHAAGRTAGRRSGGTPILRAGSSGSSRISSARGAAAFGSRT